MTPVKIPTCPACERPFRGEQGCNGFQVNAWRYGEESYWDEPYMDGYIPRARCVDCHTPLGDHHHANCLQAKCMHCDDQAVCCEHARENAEVIQ